jgi:hypothetical protein
VADDQQVLVLVALSNERIEVFQGGVGGKGLGVEDVGLIAGLGADEGGGLEAALEGAGDDEVEVYVEGVEDVCELKAVALALLIEGAFVVQERV